MIATAGSDEKAAACERLGADVGVNYRSDDFVARTLAATGGRGANVILDMVGGDYVARNYAAAAMDGRIVQIAFLRGPKAEVDLRPLMQKRLIHTGSTLRPRSRGGKGGHRRGFVGQSLAASGSRPVQAGDRFGVPARRGRQGACANGEQRACRQDCFDGLKPV